ncbi:HBR172Wp [Eremothecium sinecaudum]|uniref:HBR172Wp n=1 Tax=Eremothecium sinecaudum TaxID=45286 RepID=A0A109UX38_9SACH|nr:HBR172Wp [Eremothecium sinecaudum]AMD19073.1 HBR172Wp [Eremothecium sinecaudum]
MDSFTDCFIKFLKSLQLVCSVRQNNLQLCELSFIKSIAKKILQSDVRDEDFSSWDSFIRFLQLSGITGIDQLVEEFDYTFLESQKIPLSESSALQLELLCCILLKWIHKQNPDYISSVAKDEGYLLLETLQHSPYGEIAIVRWQKNVLSRKRDDLLKTVREGEATIQVHIKLQVALEQRLKKIADDNSELQREKMDLEILCDNKLKELGKLNKKLQKLTRDYEQLKRENEELLTENMNTKLNQVSPFERSLRSSTPDTLSHTDIKGQFEVDMETTKLEEEIIYLKQECNLLNVWIRNLLFQNA